MPKPESEFNPYAAPAVDPEFMPPPYVKGEGAWREGKLLVMSEGAGLPDRCIKCNAPAAGYRLKRTLVWHPPGWYLLILLHVLLYVIVALIVRKKVKVMLPLCEDHRRRRVTAIAVGWLLGLGGPIGGTALAATASSWPGPGSDPVGMAGVFGGLGLMLVGIIYGMTAGRAVVTKRIENKFAWMSKVCPEFLATLPLAGEPATSVPTLPYLEPLPSEGPVR